MFCSPGVDELVVIFIIEIKKEQCNEIVHNRLSDLKAEFWMLHQHQVMSSGRCDNISYPLHHRIYLISLHHLSISLYIHTPKVKWKSLSHIGLFALQARIQEWLAIPFSRGSSWPRGRTQVSHTAGRFFTIWATGDAHSHLTLIHICNRASFTDIEHIIYIYTSTLIAQLVKNPSAMQETSVQFLSQEDPLENGKATHSSILAWRIPWTIELDMTEWVSLLLFTFKIKLFYVGVLHIIIFILFIKCIFMY